MQEDLRPAPARYRAPASPPARRARRGIGPVGVRRALLVGGGLVALAALSALLYRAGTHAGPVDADSATVVLEGAAMAHGNLGLAGWALSRDSFWTIDALANMLAVLVDGVRPVLLYAVPAVLASLVVLTSAWLARAQASRAGRAVAVLTVLAFLALPSRALSLFYLQGPYHVGTALFALLAFAGLRSRRFGWGWAAAVALLGFGMLGDLQLAIFGSAPALGAGLIAMARRRQVRAGLSTAAAAPASFAFAAVVRVLADRFGTFSVNRANPQATVHEMIGNLHDIGRLGPSLLGVGMGPYLPPLPTDVPAGVADLHVLLIAALVAGAAVAVVLAVVGVVRGSEARLGAEEGDWHVEDLLVLAFLADLATFLRLDMASNPQFARYLTAAIIFGAILAARLVGRATDVAGRRLTPAVVGVTAALFLTFGAGFGESVAGAAATNPATTLATLLEQRHLTRGLGDYWSASIVTVESAGAVVVRPVVDAPNGKVYRYSRENDAAWYRGHRFQFVVEEPGLGLVQPAAVKATFGPWASSFTTGPYEVFVFSHPIAVSTVAAGT